MKIDEAKKHLDDNRRGSAWDCGVNMYAWDILDHVYWYELDNRRRATSRGEFREWALDGARNWTEYSYGGNALVYDSDIAHRLCTASELRRTRYGHTAPNREENWLDVQARALYQAAELAERLYFA